MEYNIEHKRSNPLKIFGLVIIVITAAFGGGYLITYKNIQTAADSVFSQLRNVEPEIEIISVTLIPPTAEIEIRQTVNNPTDYGFTLIIDGELYISDEFVDDIHFKKEIQSNSRTTINIPIHLGSSIMEVAMSEEDLDMEWEGKIIVTTKMFGIIPVTIKEDISYF